MAESVSRRELLRVAAVFGASAAVGGPLIWELIRSGRLRRVSESRNRLGTVVTLTVVHPDQRAAHEIVARGFAEIDRLECVFSRYRYDTPVSRLNRTGYVEAPPRELVALLRDAQAVSRYSQGAFDVTVLPLLDLLRRSFEQSGAPPSARVVDAALVRVGYQRLTVRDDHLRLEPGMAITLDGIAKGRIVDATRDVLTDAGADRVYVDAGGDISTHMSNLGMPWQVAIQDPDAPMSPASVVRLGSGSIATSGDYMRTFTRDRDHHHILDPTTGRSARGVASVSVVHESAMWADGLSTAAMVMGPERAMAASDLMNGAEALWILTDGSRVTTAGFDSVHA